MKEQEKKDMRRKQDQIGVIFVHSLFPTTALCSRFFNINEYSMTKIYLKKTLTFVFIRALNITVLLLCGTY